MNYVEGVKIFSASLIGSSIGYQLIFIPTDLAPLLISNLTLSIGCLYMMFYVILRRDSN